MAARQESAGGHGQQLIYDGHVMRLVEALPNFIGQVPFDFTKTFTLNCPSAPTSWLLQLTFKRETRDDGVSCFVSIWRRDKRRIYVDTDFWMTATTPADNTVCRSNNLTVHHMAPTQRAGKYVVRFIPNSVERQMEDHHHILLEVTFGVHGCHDERVSGNEYFPPTEEDFMYFFES